jgi:hypothetical protein
LQKQQSTFEQKSDDQLKSYQQNVQKQFDSLKSQIAEQQSELSNEKQQQTATKLATAEQISAEIKTLVSKIGIQLH